MTGPAPGPLLRLAPPHAPWSENGEEQVARMLELRHLRYFYEQRLYPLRIATDGHIQKAFCPDFHLPATAERPALNIEVTFADRGLPQQQRERYQANQLRLGEKRWKIRETSRLYGIETVLITRQIYRRLLGEPELLDRLIRQAAQRHRRLRRLAVTPAAA